MSGSSDEWPTSGHHPQVVGPAAGHSGPAVPVVEGHPVTAHPSGDRPMRVRDLATTHQARPNRCFSPTNRRAVTTADDRAQFHGRHTPPATNPTNSAMSQRAFDLYLICYVVCNLLGGC